MKQLNVLVSMMKNCFVKNVEGTILRLTYLRRFFKETSLIEAVPSTELL